MSMWNSWVAYSFLLKGAFFEDWLSFPSHRFDDTSVFTVTHQWDWYLCWSSAVLLLWLSFCNESLFYKNNISVEETIARLVSFKTFYIYPALWHGLGKSIIQECFLNILPPSPQPPWWTFCVILPSFVSLTGHNLGNKFRMKGIVIVVI